MSKHVTMSQWETQAAQYAAAALSDSDLSIQAAFTGEAAGLVFHEMPLCGLLTIRSSVASDSLSAALKHVLKLELPSTLRATMQGDYCLRWMSPDEWLLSCPMVEAFDIENQLRTALEGHVALVNVSCGYQCIELQGPDATTVLQKSTGYDVHIANLPVGKIVNTTFAKTQVTLRCKDDGRYELIVRRSFADYLWHWLNEAAREHGVVATRS